MNPLSGLNQTAMNLSAGVLFDSLEAANEAAGNIDWDGYLRDYPDVELAGIDPRKHFLIFGWHEGRKVRFKSEALTDSIVLKPKVAVILPNYNNSTFLPYSLSSLLNQTLKDIEIIIVDDCSTDNSINIIESYASLDARIKLIKFTKNQNRHMARKVGVLASSAQYLMFLDPDDYFSLDACEIAYNSIIHGYDIVYFNTTFIDEKGTYVKNNPFNIAAAREYIGEEIIDAMLNKREIKLSLWNKIFSASLFKKVLSTLEDGYFPFAEDCYTVIALGHDSLRLKKIDDYLHFYRLGFGTSSNKDLKRIGKEYSNFWTLIPAFERLCESRNILLKAMRLKKEMIFSNIRNFLKTCALQYTMAYLSAAYSAIGMTDLISAVGSLEVKEIISLINGLYAGKSSIEYSSNTIENDTDNPKLAAIYLKDIDGLQEIMILQELSRYAVCGNLRILILSDQQPEICQNHDSGFAWIYVPDPGTRMNEFTRHATEMGTILEQTRPDALFYCDIHGFQLALVLLAASVVEVPVIGIAPESAGIDIVGKSRQYMSPGVSYHHDPQLQVLRSLAHLVCSSAASRAYYEANGIAATCSEPPALGLSMEDQTQGETIDGHNFMYLAGQDFQLSQYPEAIKILSLLVEMDPEACMWAINTSSKDNNISDLKNMAQAAGLAGNLHIFRGFPKRINMAQSCGAMLSTSFIGGWRPDLVLANGLRIPVVAYETGDESTSLTHVVYVAQKDRHAAAARLAKLLHLQRFPEDSTSNVSNTAAAGGSFARLFKELCLNPSMKNANKSKMEAVRSALDEFRRYAHKGFPGHNPL